MMTVSTSNQAEIVPRQLFSGGCEHPPQDSHRMKVPEHHHPKSDMTLEQHHEDVGSHCPDVLTTSTDDDSVSSLSTVGDIFDDDNDSLSGATPTGSSTRSIFQCYWNKSSLPRQPLRPSREPCSHERMARIPFAVSGADLSDDENSSSSCFSYERTLRKNEGVTRPSTATTSPVTPPPDRRRSIFGESRYASLSMSSLRGDVLPTLVYRKSNSAGDLEGTKRLPSCLKAPRKRERSHSSVSFSSEVTVLEFKETQEAWAAEGWSKYFH